MLKGKVLAPALKRLQGKQQVRRLWNCEDILLHLCHMTGALTDDLAAEASAKGRWGRFRGKWRQEKWKNSYWC